MTTVPDMIAPDIGTLFTHQDRSYVVEGWAKRMAPPERAAADRDPLGDALATVLYEAQQECGPDRARLVFCDRLEAEYVVGRGVAGCLARIADIEITGTADWPTDRLQEQRTFTARLAGHPIH